MEKFGGKLQEGYFEGWLGQLFGGVRGFYIKF